MKKADAAWQKAIKEGDTEEIEYQNEQMRRIKKDLIGIEKKLRRKDKDEEYAYWNRYAE